MRYIQPDYLAQFRCLQGSCRHSCCRGWEIDIDPDTLELYHRLPGVLGQALRASIDADENGAHFRLTADACCPFLQADGLCRLILHLGEGALCQICADHPRFRSFFPDRVELGLGLCCEAACELILRQKTPMKLVELPPDNIPVRSLSPAQRELLALREDLIALAQDESQSLGSRIQAIRMKTGAAVPHDWERWAAFLLRLERMDAAWMPWLEALRDHPTALPGTDPSLLRMASRLLVYLLYRHMPSHPRRGVSYALFIAELLPRLLAAGGGTAEDFPELCCLYSAELEYGEGCMDRILRKLLREAL